MIGFTEEERQEALSLWAGVISFCALLYLTGYRGPPV
jgi:hypothetical protein